MPTEQTHEQKIAACPEELQTIIEEFEEATDREKLDYLVDYSIELPDLPERLHALRDQMEQVHECQTAVFLHTELDDDGTVNFFFDIPREAPTVRGYAGLLVEGLTGSTPTEILGVPEDIYMLLGLHKAITPQRLRGLHALIRYMKRQVIKLEG